MKHKIEVISVDMVRNHKSNRNFEVKIDEIHIKGQVKFMWGSQTNGVKAVYRFSFGKGSTIIKHPDYKDIRRNLLRELIRKTERCMTPDGVR